MTLQIEKIETFTITKDLLDKIYQAVGYDAYKLAMEKRHKPSRISVAIKDETVWDKLKNGRQRPYTTFKKEIIPAVLKEMKLPIDTRVHWNQKAGSLDGQNPAFTVEKDFGRDVTVTITMTEDDQPVNQTNE